MHNRAFVRNRRTKTGHLHTDHNGRQPEMSAETAHRQEVMKMADDRLEVYTLKQVSEIMSVTVRELYSMIQNGELQAFKCGRQWRITRQMLDEYIARNTATPAPKETRKRGRKPREQQEPAHH